MQRSTRTVFLSIPGVEGGGSFEQAWPGVNYRSPINDTHTRRERLLAYGRPVVSRAWRLTTDD